MQLLISAIVQVLIFSLIPLIWWVVTARHQEGFFAWLGIKGCTFTPKMWGWIVGGTVVLGVAYVEAVKTGRFPDDERHAW